MQIFYWAPYLSNIATINAVKRSAEGFKKFDKKEYYDVSIINSCGEWNFYKNNNYKIKILNNLPINFYNFLPKIGLIQSRLSFILIFVTNFIPLIWNIKKYKPKYLIIHLLTLLPIILSPIISKKTKIILRISGLPKMHFFRKFMWKKFSKYIHLVTAPTELTAKSLIEMDIFEADKIKVIRDPVINCKEINFKKKVALDENYLKEKYYLSIGRLTGQKNYKFLIKVFSKNLDIFTVKKLIIIGEGEDFKSLSKMIKDFGMEKNIFLLGFKENIYRYINNCSALLSTAEYEDPGFTLIEGAFLRKKIISSLVKNGPLEMKKNGDLCYFFKANDELDFLNQILVSERDLNFRDKLQNAQKFSKQFTIFSHYKTFKNLFR